MFVGECCIYILSVSMDNFVESSCCVKLLETKTSEPIPPTEY